MSDTNPNDYGIDGHQWTNPYIEVGQGYKVGGQWRHFVPYQNYDDYEKYCTWRDNHCNHNFKNHKNLLVDINFSRMFAGNLSNLQHLKDVVKKNEPKKKIYVDFMNIMSGFNVFGTSTIVSREQQLNIFRALDILNFYGFLVVVFIPTDIDSDTAGNFFSSKPNVWKIVYTNPIEKITAMLNDNDDITKVMYVGSDLCDISMTNGQRNPIYLTSASSLYLNKNVADYVTQSKDSETIFSDIATAILTAFDINPFTFYNKTRMDIFTNVYSNYVREIGNNVVFTESSMKYRDVYEPILTGPAYGISSEYFKQSYSYLGIDDQKKFDDIYIATDWKFMTDNIDNFEKNRVYFLTDSIDVTETKTIEFLKTLDNVSSVGLNWCILTKHLPYSETMDLYNYLLSQNLYNALSLTDLYLPPVQPD